jgi:hypothetical protein
MYDPAGTPERAYEWVELEYTGTTSRSIEGWTLEDNRETDPLPDAWLTPGGLVLVVASALVGLPPGATPVVVEVADGTLGNGLANTGDRVVFRDATGQIIDAVSWGNDTFAGVTACPRIHQGHSLQRVAGGHPAACGFEDNPEPSPGLRNRPVLQPTATATRTGTATITATATITSTVSATATGTVHPTVTPTATGRPVETATPRPIAATVRRATAPPNYPEAVVGVAPTLQRPRPGRAALATGATLALDDLAGEEPSAVAVEDEESDGADTGESLDGVLRHEYPEHILAPDAEEPLSAPPDDVSTVLPAIGFLLAGVLAVVALRGRRLAAAGHA